MAAGLVAFIRTVNREFHAFLGWADACHGDRPVAPERFQQLTNRLDQVGQMLDNSPDSAQPDAELKTELAQYAENLERLRPALETIRCALLAHRAELETQRAHLEAVGAWAVTCREID